MSLNEGDPAALSQAARSVKKVRSAFAKAGKLNPKATTAATNPQLRIALSLS